jgi:hypothetical protein
VNTNLAGPAFLFAAYVINRFIMTGATKKLADSEKLKIHDVFSKRNNYATIFTPAIILLFFGAAEFVPHLIIQITVVYLIIFVLYLVFRFVSNYKKLKQMEMPAAYIKSFIASYSIFAPGFSGMVFCVFRSWVR